MSTPRDILDALLANARKAGNKPAVSPKPILERIEYVCRCLGNRACVRLLMS